VDFLKLPGCSPISQVVLHLQKGDLTHTSTQRIAYKESLIDHGFPFEISITRKRYRFSDALLSAIGGNRILVVTEAIVRAANDGLRLVTALPSQSAMRGHDIGS
jgi:hypothetical protein